MADFPIDEFEFLVRDFLADKKSWNDVHRFVIDAEWTNAAQIPGGHQDSNALIPVQRLDPPILCQVQRFFLGQNSTPNRSRKSIYLQVERAWISKKFSIQSRE